MGLARSSERRLSGSLTVDACTVDLFHYWAVIKLFRGDVLEIASTGRERLELCLQHRTPN